VVAESGLREADQPQAPPLRPDKDSSGHRRSLAIGAASIAVVAVSLVAYLVLRPGKSGKSQTTTVATTTVTTPRPSVATTASPSTSTTHLRPVFADDFTNPSSGWVPDLSQDGNGSAAYRADGYHVSVLKSLPVLNTFSVASPYQPKLFSLSVSVTAAMLTGAPADGSGVRCDEGDRLHLRYSFEIHGDGSWVVFKLGGQGGPVLLQGTSPNVINTGAGSNLISGTCTEVGVGMTKLIFAVNGVTLGTATDTHAGRIAWHAGLVAYRSSPAHATEVRFNNFRTVDNSA
jgi:hypothetical protein